MHGKHVGIDLGESKDCGKDESVERLQKNTQHDDIKAVEGRSRDGKKEKGEKGKKKVGEGVVLEDKKDSKTDMHSNTAGSGRVNEHDKHSGLMMMFNYMLATSVQEEHDLESRKTKVAAAQTGGSSQINVKDLPAIKEMESKRRVHKGGVDADAVVTHIKAVDLEEPITSAESNVWGFIFEKGPGQHKKEMISRGDATAADFGTKLYYYSDFVFKGKNTMVGKHLFTSMDVGQQVANFVIDAWMDVLNHQETQKKSDAPRRLFCGTNVIVDWMLNDKTSEPATRLAAFEKKMYGAVYRDTSVADLREFDLIFFPILECAHYYLVVFDLENMEINVIDNRASAQKIARLKDNTNYFLKHTAYKVKNLFVSYLELKGHPKAESMKDATANMVKTCWATSANGTDCGVFLMRHMEMYMGSGRPFECGFTPIGAMKKNQLAALRKKMVARMLLSEANLMKDELKKAVGIH